MKTIGMARLGRDAEVRYTPGGDAVCNLSLAFPYGQKDQSGNRPTQWIDATLWGKRAEVLAEYLLKGSNHCFTLSDIHMETYQGKNGEGHKLVARVDDVELGPRASGSDSGERQERPASRPASGGQGNASRNNAPAAGKTADGMDADDDIPF